MSRRRRRVRACGRWTAWLALACGVAACSGEASNGDSAAGAPGHPGRIGTSGVCGDGRCEAGEGCQACPSDCGACFSVQDGFVLLPAGTFTMGSPPDEPKRRDDEGPPHEVTLSHDFFMAVHEVTQAEWEAFFDANPSDFSECPQCPVEDVTWFEALAFANALSEEQGLAPCYVLDDCGTPPGRAMRCLEVAVDAPDGNPYACEGYRLPTEAEWEYAYRAGTHTAFYNGAVLDPACADANLDAIGWYCGNAEGRTHEVGQKLPNAWGLYDMAGNVWEWCWDGYDGGFYAVSPSVDPVGAPDNLERVSRGGSWNAQAWSARAANRESDIPGYHAYDLGLRLVRTANP